MRRIRKNRKGTKRMDLSSMKQALQDSRRWCVFGKVAAAQDGGSHFILDDRDLLVDVILQPSLEEVTCRVAFSAGGPGWGIWSIPPVGAEVAVVIPDGEDDFQPTVIATYSSNDMPENIAEGRIVISCAPGQEVYIHDGSGTVDALVKKSEFEAHQHNPPTIVGASYAAGFASANFTSTPDAITGTEVLKAK